MRRRMSLLMGAFDDLRRAMGTEWRQVALNPHVLRDVLEHYARDLVKTKQDHGIRWADAHKRAGFTLKWICKLRPVQLLGDTATPGEGPTWEELIANEIFAVHVAANFLGTVRGEIGVGFYDSLLHLCRCREADPELVSALMYLVQAPAAPGLGEEDDPFQPVI